MAEFPAHWAPNEVLIYEGNQFLTAYKDGAFIAFHGSWNRAPEPQGGYNVVFQPLADGKASGPFVVFAEGFAGAVKQPGQAAHRPTGLAVAPDGLLYIADDQRGRIWHVTFQGGNKASGIAAAARRHRVSRLRPSGNPLPPEGIHPNAGAAALRYRLARRRIRWHWATYYFTDKLTAEPAWDVTARMAKALNRNFDFTDGKWLWGNGSVRLSTDHRPGRPASRITTSASCRQWAARNYPKPISPQ